LDPRLRLANGSGPDSHGDWSRYEGERSPFTAEQLALLESWDPGRDPYIIMNVIKNMIPEFLRVHRNLCQKLQMDENREWVKQIIGMVF
jgi:hypothetical protein